MRGPVRFEVREVVLARLDDIGQRQIAQALPEAGPPRTPWAWQFGSTRTRVPDPASRTSDTIALACGSAAKPSPSTWSAAARSGIADAPRPAAGPRSTSLEVEAIARGAVTVELDASERRRLVGADDPIEVHARLLERPAQLAPVPVGRQPADEHRMQPEPPERPRRVERAAPQMRRRASAGLEHEVDDRLAGDRYRTPVRRCHAGTWARPRSRAGDADCLLPHLVWPNLVQPQLIDVEPVPLSQGASPASSAGTLTSELC